MRECTRACVHVRACTSVPIRARARVCAPVRVSPIPEAAVGEDGDFCGDRPPGDAVDGRVHSGDRLVHVVSGRIAVERTAHERRARPLVGEQ